MRATIQRRFALAATRPSEETSLTSILTLTRDLVSFPTQGGIDRQAPALHYVADWLESRGVSLDFLEAPRRTPRNKAIGLIARVGRPNVRPTYCLTACLDTAPIGLVEDWDYHPTSAQATRDGWVIGRGVADSKIGLAIFCHLLVELKRQESQLNGRLIFLIDSDEHTGRFGAVKALLREEPRIDGVYIGYPGLDTIKIGARGFYRAKVKFYGISAHSGASRPSRENAIIKAARFSLLADESEFELDEGIGHYPQLTITQIDGGKGYSMVPDHCVVRADYRLTTSFRASDAKRHLRSLVGAVDSKYSPERKTRIESEKSWPAYILGEQSRVRVALEKAFKREMKESARCEVSGPSNVGNFFSEHGIESTCGFGVRYRSIHAANEAIDLSSIMTVVNIYRAALRDLLGLKG